MKVLNSSDSLDLSRRLKKLATLAAKKKQYSYLSSPLKIVKLNNQFYLMYRRNLLHLISLKIIDRVFFLRLNKFVVLMLRRRIYSKIDKGCDTSVCVGFISYRGRCCLYSVSTKRLLLLITI